MLDHVARGHVAALARLALADHDAVARDVGHAAAAEAAPVARPAEPEAGTPQAGQRAALQRAPLGHLEQDRRRHGLPSLIFRHVLARAGPVEAGLAAGVPAARRHPRRVLEREAGEVQVPDGLGAVGAAAHHDQLRRDRGDGLEALDLLARHGPVREHPGGPVEVPLAGGVEQGRVVLDEVPRVRLETVDVPEVRRAADGIARGQRPRGGVDGGDGVARDGPVVQEQEFRLAGLAQGRQVALAELEGVTPVHDLGHAQEPVVGVPRARPALAAHEEFAEGPRAGLDVGHRGLPDVAIGLPSRDGPAAAQDRRLARPGRIGDGAVPGAAVLGPEDDGPGHAVHPTAHQDEDVGLQALGDLRPDGVAGARERGERFLGRAGSRVIAARGNAEVGTGGRGPRLADDAHQGETGQPDHQPHPAAACHGTFLLASRSNRPARPRVSAERRLASGRGWPRRDRARGRPPSRGSHLTTGSKIRLGRAASP